MINQVSDVASIQKMERLQTGLAIFALAMIVFGAKILFIRYYGSAVPYWDQWDAEADQLYKSYLNSGLSWTALFSPHNEHRILITRLLSLVLFEIDGGWDPILQMLVNAALHTVAIVLIVKILDQMLQSRDIVLLVAFSAFVFVVPVGWENLLAGFQSEFYFLLIFSALALVGFCTFPAFSACWFFSLVISIAAYFSMASGALVGLATFCVLAAQCLVGVRRGGKEFAAAVIVLLSSVAMICDMPNIAAHDGLKAHGRVEFIRALISCLEYPWPSWRVGLVVNLPLATYAVYVVKTRPQLRSSHWIVLALIMWWLGQMTSISYGRAVAPNSSRYLDLTIVALPINFAILLFFRSAFWARRQWVAIGTAVWLLLVCVGLATVTVRSVLPNVNEKEAQSTEQQDNVIRYLKTGDISVLQDKAQLAIPYPVPERLASLLSDPEIRLILPQVIRPAEINEATLFQSTWLKGKYHRSVESIKRAIFDFAPIFVGVGIALILLAGTLMLPDIKNPSGGQ